MNNTSREQYILEVIRKALMMADGHNVVGAKLEDGMLRLRTIDRFTRGDKFYFVSVKAANNND